MREEASGEKKDYQREGEEERRLGECAISEMEMEIGGGQEERRLGVHEY